MAAAQQTVSVSHVHYDPAAKCGVVTSRSAPLCRPDNERYINSIRSSYFPQRNKMFRYFVTQRGASCQQPLLKCWDAVRE